MEWRGWHAFRRGLATNLDALGVHDIVIQPILRHSNVAVTRQPCIKHTEADERSVTARDWGPGARSCRTMTQVNDLPAAEGCVSG